jgi:hypothetical protein
MQETHEPQHPEIEAIPLDSMPEHLGYSEAACWDDWADVS